MKRPVGLAAICALAASAAGASPASAQYHPAPGVHAPAPPAPALGPHHADAAVRSLGLHPVSRPEARGHVFVVHALGQEGSQVVVTLDRYSGRVLGIVRAGYGAPRIAVVPPAGGPAAAPGYDYDEEDYVALEEDFAPPPGVYRAPRDVQPQPGAMRDADQGPSVITRRGIEAGELPPPGLAPRDGEREPEITGSVPRGVYRGPERGPADPLLGVPKEFRGQPSAPQPHIAARPREAVPRTAPLPRPRPADAPEVAERKSAPADPPRRTEPEDESPPAVTPVDPERVPDVQGFE